MSMKPVIIETQLHYWHTTKMEALPHPGDHSAPSPTSPPLDPTLSVSLCSWRDMSVSGGLCRWV